MDVHRCAATIAARRIVHSCKLTDPTYTILVDLVIDTYLYQTWVSERLANTYYLGVRQHCGICSYLRVVYILRQLWANPRDPGLRR